MRYAIAALLALLSLTGLTYSPTAKAATNLAITCPSAVEGAGDDPKYANGVFCNDQYQQRVTPTTKVLSCLPGGGCNMDTANQAWRSFGLLPPGSLVHICGHDVPEGKKDCSLPGNSASFADQKIVPMEQVARAEAESFTAEIAWTPPTTNVDGAVLAAGEALTEYRIYSAWNQPLTVYTGPDGAHITVPASAASWHYAEYGTSHAPGDTLYVSMVACNAAGCSAPTNPVSKKIGAAPPKVPATPTGVSIAQATSALINALQQYLAMLQAQ
ncbi:hypothetical protein UFOVP119_33 [uncultured Caudovirales phage]|uniref:Uncharacterized protein n=1 Tax=uncultured Caudovirales phage TaxID=2100421 RepID=A0A6J5LFJ1_9CAUD|nr:hypothetical protein UFOVP119_33 [uncultured Caudovirales phage]